MTGLVLLQRLKCTTPPNLEKDPWTPPLAQRRREHLRFQHWCASQGLTRFETLLFLAYVMDKGGTTRTPEHHLVRYFVKWTEMLASSGEQPHRQLRV